MCLFRHWQRCHCFIIMPWDLIEYVFSLNFLRCLGSTIFLWILESVCGFSHKYIPTNFEWYFSESSTQFENHDFIKFPPYLLALTSRCIFIHDLCTFLCLCRSALLIFCVLFHCLKCLPLELVPFSCLCNLCRI